MLKILIAEDNLILAKDMARSLQQYNCEVVAIARSAEEAIAQFDELEPNFVMIDIELEGEKDGIDLAVHINNTCRVPFIFLTDHFGSRDSYFKRANAAKPSGYLPKGTFLPNQLWHFVETALNSFAGGDIMLKDDDAALFLRNQFFVKNHKTWEKIHADEITHIIVSKPYCQIFIKAKTGKYMVRKSLEFVMEQINSIPLIRISRSCAVNARYIYQYHQAVSKIILEDKTELELSRKFAGNFLQRMQFLV